jgi:hypothetical protein
MQARYPKNIVLLVEGLVAPLDDDAAIRWMRERAESLRSNADVPHALVYRKQRSSGTLAKPRFLSAFETPERVSEMHPRITNVHVWSFDFLATL